ncbi:hypothetical protein [Streptacidiphilus monticola]|uniref:Uncharacterized protein n=1 Tax=Streptacidiphilus monticola TaxID=2161674 RepID=A0ABW1FZA8_9ACTN
MTAPDEELLVKITKQVDGSFTASPLHPPGRHDGLGRPFSLPNSAAT